MMINGTLTMMMTGSLTLPLAPSLILPEKKRNREEPFSDDDQWMFDPSLDAIMTGGGVTTSRLLDLHHVGACRNWKNMLNKRFEATLKQHCDVTNKDDLGTDMTNALQRAIEQQIEAHNTLTPIPLYISPCSPTTLHMPSNPTPSRCAYSKTVVNTLKLTNKQ